MSTVAPRNRSCSLVLRKNRLLGPENCLRNAQDVKLRQSALQAAPGSKRLTAITVAHCSAAESGLRDANRVQCTRWPGLAPGSGLSK